MKKADATQFSSGEGEGGISSALNTLEVLMYMAGVYPGGLTCIVGPNKSLKTVEQITLADKLVRAGKIVLLVDRGAPLDLLRRLGLLMDDNTGHLGLLHLEPRLFADLEKEICRNRESLHCVLVDQLAGISLVAPERDRYAFPHTDEEATLALIEARAERVNQVYRLSDYAHNFRINIVLAVDPSAPHLPDTHGFGFSETKFPEVVHIADAWFLTEPMGHYDIDYRGPLRYKLTAKKLPSELAQFEGQSCVLQLTRKTAQLSVVQD